MDNNNTAFNHLDRAGRTTALIASTTNTVTFVVITLSTIFAWMILAGMAGRVSPLDAGPGGEAFAWLTALPLPWPLDSLVAYCLKPLAPGTGFFTSFMTMFAMWIFMSLAMMLPPAAPLVRTYCEIADTARAAGRDVVHPLWLVSGFILVWVVASAAFALTAILIGQIAAGNEPYAPAVAPIAAAILAVAGLYQFTNLKNLCLVKCRNPFSTLFGNWSFDRVRIIKLGIKQGLWCLGCCWALMLVMFAVGTMNIIWMALLTAYSVVEKSYGGHTLSRLAGAILLVWALAVLLISI